MSLVLSLTGSYSIFVILSSVILIHKDSNVIYKVILASMVARICKQLLLFFHTYTGWVYKVVYVQLTDFALLKTE